MMLLFAWNTCARIRLCEWVRLESIELSYAKPPARVAGVMCMCLGVWSNGLHVVARTPAQNQQLQVHI